MEFKPFRFYIIDSNTDWPDVTGTDCPETAAKASMTHLVIDAAREVLMTNRSGVGIEEIYEFEDESTDHE